MCFEVDKFSYNYLRNRKHFPCFYRVIETRVEVWEKREIPWEHEHEVRVFPTQFRVSPKLTQQQQTYLHASVCVATCVFSYSIAVFTTTQNLSNILVVRTNIDTKPNG
jgi:uncharacterized membrane protein